MKKGGLLLTALLTASFLVACENKQKTATQQPAEQQATQEGTPAQQPAEQQATQEETAPAEQPQQEETMNKETTNEEGQGTEGEETGEEGSQTTGEEGNQGGGEEAGEEAKGVENGQESAGGDAKKGQQLFTANGCTACHQEKADTVGPALAKIAQAYAGKKEDLIKFLKGEGKSIVDPAKFSIMEPNLKKTKALADGDLSALADYILSIK